MRKINPTTQVPSQFLDRIGSALRNGKNNQNRTNYYAVSSTLKSLFRAYNRNLVPMNLQSLTPHTGFTEPQIKTVHNLYESGEKEFDKLWDELKKANGGSILRCPICGVSFAKELDHYVPRELFPEFSANPLNIIPLCHDCNHDKGAKWKDDTGYRLIFNAYFDELSQKKLLKCEINQILNGLPLAEVSTCTIANPDDVDKRALKTIEELNLTTYYTNYVNKDLATEVCQMQDDYSIKRGAINNSREFWADRRNTYAVYLTNPSKYTEERILLYEALISSPVFDTWIIANL